MRLSTGVVNDSPEDFSPCRFELARFDETFTHDQVRMRKIRQGFEEDLANGVLVVVTRVELVKFQNGQVGLQIVGNLARLGVDVGFERGEMFGIVSVDASKQIGHLGPHRFRICHFFYCQILVSYPLKMFNLLAYKDKITYFKTVRYNICMYNMYNM